MADVDRNDPDLKFLVVDRNSFSDPATQAEWSQKRLVWVPHEQQGFVAGSMTKKVELLLATSRPSSSWSHMCLMQVSGVREAMFLVWNVLSIGLKSGIRTFSAS